MRRTAACVLRKVFIRRLVRRSCHFRSRCTAQVTAHNLSPVLHDPWLRAVSPIHRDRHSVVPGDARL